MADIGLNSVALQTIAQTMRDQTAPPNNEMSYSDFAGTTATYAVINAMELIASGLAAEELRVANAKIDAYLTGMKGMQRIHEQEIAYRAEAKEIKNRNG